MNIRSCCNNNSVQFFFPSNNNSILHQNHYIISRPFLTSKTARLVLSFNSSLVSNFDILFLTVPSARYIFSAISLLSYPEAIYCINSSSLSPNFYEYKKKKWVYWFAFYDTFMYFISLYRSM